MVGVLIGILILVAGFMLKKLEVKRTALGVFVFSSIAAIFAYFSGEGAEEAVEHLSGISETLIHTHEEYADYFFTLTLVLGGLSIVGFIADLKKFKYFQQIAILILVVALADGLLAKYVGTSGGEIRHTEIRGQSPIINLQMETNSDTNTKNDDDNDDD
jgi:hypothetical protein